MNVEKGRGIQVKYRHLNLQPKVTEKAATTKKCMKPTVCACLQLQTVSIDSVANQAHFIRFTCLETKRVDFGCGNYCYFLAIHLLT